jgi:hypothetical protein
MKLFLCAFALSLAGCNFYSGSDTKDSRAKFDMMAIEKAIKKAYIESEGTRWPAQLEDIVNFLENGSVGLLDPWGNEYKFAIVEIKQDDSKVGERPFIWTERTVHGKAKVVRWPESMELTEYLKDDARKEMIAKNDVAFIEQACKKYHLDSGKWPLNLDDIANMLESGEAGLVDPWGNKYKFTAGKMKAADGTQVVKAYVWSDRTVNGFPRVCGSKPPEAKKKSESPLTAEPK